VDGGQWALSTSIRASGIYNPQGATTSTLRPGALSATGAAPTQKLAYGTATGQVNLIVAQDRAIAATTAVLFDLYTGTDLKDLAGLTAAFRHLRSIAVWIVSGGDTTGIRMGGAGLNESTLWFEAVGDMMRIYPGGPPFLQGSPAGVVIDATHKMLKVENLGAVAATVRVQIAGATV